MAIVVDPDWQALVSPWGFHLDLLGHGDPPWPWQSIECENLLDESFDERSSRAELETSPVKNGSRASVESVLDAKNQKHARKLEKRGALRRGFLTRAKDTKAERTTAAIPLSAMENTSATSSASTSTSTSRKKKYAPGHYWNTPAQKFEFSMQREIKVENWSGIELSSQFEKPVKKDPCSFYKLLGIVPREDTQRILAHCKQSQEYKTDPDSVDKTPTFEFYPFRDGEWVDTRMQGLLVEIVSNRLLPYVRERYDCQFCAISDILVRRYLPGERRTHAVHFDGHAYVTAVLGLSDPDDYEGGLYLQPEPDIASRAYIHIEPGDLVIHSFDLQHGIHVWKGVRYSLIFWIKDSLQAVRNRSTPWYDKLADMGDPDALYNIAQNYEYGMFGRPLDLSKAIQLYERSAAAGNHFAQNNLGLVYRRAHEQIGLANGMTKAVESLQAAAEAGFAMAQKNLGLAFANGHGVRKDDTQAILWLRRAAEQLEVEAAYMMAEMYRQGRGVPIDLREAAKWYERSAEAGFPKAQYSLGMFCLEGHGVEKDARRAEMWFGFAAKQGESEAKNNLATMYAQRGDVDHAAQIWSELAKVGEPNAQCNLGMCYMRGLGREQDSEEALRWLRMAARQGHQMAIEAIVGLGGAS